MPGASAGEGGTGAGAEGNGLLVEAVTPRSLTCTWTTSADRNMVAPQLVAAPDGIESADVS